MTQKSTAPIAILGMHRSGTSCLAGCLEEAGLFLGEVNTKAPANARGNRENRAIMDLHDAVLATHGFRWDNPPKQQLDWHSEQDQRRDALIADYPANGLWGFKDPRSLLVLDAWLDAIPTLRLVGSVRHPASVAASLKRRNGFSWEQGYDLWFEYNQHLLRWLQQRKFPLVNFDLTPLEYRAVLEKLYPTLGLDIPKTGIRFFSDNLRNQQPKESPALPDAVVDLYKQLLSYALCP